MKTHPSRLFLAAILGIFVFALATTEVRAQWSLLTTLENQSDGQADDGFGSAVAISGHTLVVGAPGHNQSNGVVYVFTEDSNGFWSGVAELTASDAVAHIYFGGSVGINGNTIVVGASDPCLECTLPGAAYVFVKPSTGWTDMTETAKLTASDGSGQDLFGGSVAVSNNTIAVGASEHQVGSNVKQGAAYIFVKPTAGWTNMTETAELSASDGATGNGLGTSVALAGSTLVAGAWGAMENSFIEAGAVYVFLRPSTGWTNEHETAKLTATDPSTFATLGLSVAISADERTVVAGAPFRQDGNVPYGAAYIFTKPAGGWQSATQTSELLPPRAAQAFGLDVTINPLGTVIAVGAPYTLTTGLPSAGAAYVYVKSARGWALTPKANARLNPPPPETQGVFGSSVAVRGLDVVVGEPGATVNGNASQGAARIFVRQ
jgi:hypothetical protein